MVGSVGSIGDNILPGLPGGTPLTPTIMRTVISTRNGIPALGANGSANNTTANGGTCNAYRHDRPNNSQAVARNIALRVHAFGFNPLMQAFTSGGDVVFYASVSIGGSVYYLTQNGNRRMICPAGSWMETDPLPSSVTLAPGQVATPRVYNDLTAPGYSITPCDVGVLAARGEYSGYYFQSSTPNNTGGADKPASNTAGSPGWLVGDVPYGTPTFLAIDDSKGYGLLESGNVGNAGIYPMSYTGDANGNAGIWNRALSVLGMNGLNLSKSSSSAGGKGVAGQGWANGDLSLLINSLQGLSFTHLCYGLGQNDPGTVPSVMQGWMNTIHNKFKQFLIPGGDVVCRHLTPSTGNTASAVSNTSYSGTTAVDTVTAAFASAVSAAGLTKFVKSGANQTGFVGVFPITAVDTTANTIAYTVGSGLTVPTNFGSANDGWGTTALQTAADANADSYRQQINAMIDGKTYMTGQTKVFNTRSDSEILVGGLQKWQQHDCFGSTGDGIHETPAQYGRYTTRNASGLM